MDSSDMGSLTVGIIFGIIALSLTLLTGYAGEINLAPVSFGAIATIIVFHLGLSGSGTAQRITFWGLLLGMASRPSSGASSRSPPSACVASTWPWPPWPSASSSPT